MAKKLDIKELGLILVLTLVSAFFFFFKLDYPYFFTDEILYKDTGDEYLKGDYSSNLQHPLIGKYLVGVASLVSSENVYTLRFPFALMGVLSSLVVFFIIKYQFKNNLWAFMGGMLYISMPFLYSSTRMVMFEAPMHLFWLLFHLFFLKFLHERKVVYTIMSGLFLGLGMASKHATMILYPFVLIIFIYFQYSEKNIKKLKDLILSLKELIPVYLISFVVFGLTYADFLIKRGIEGAKELVKETFKIYFGRNTEGKEHVVGGVVYNKSPAWFYLYYFIQKYNPIHLILTFLSPLILVVRKNFFVVYWGVFLLFTVVFFQLIPLKNDRYIASMELSLVFLILAFLKYLFEKSKITKILIVALLLLIFVLRLVFVINQPKTEYHGIYDYFKQKTNNFEKYERMYVLGSIRSSKWYRKQVPNEHMFIYRRDYEIMCDEFGSFNYFVFDKSELPKYLDSLLYRYVTENKDSFVQKDVADMILFERKEGSVSGFGCGVGE